TAGELLNGGDPLRRRKRRSVGKDQHGDAEAHPRRHTREIGEACQRVEVSAPGAFRVVRRNRDVIDYPHVPNRRNGRGGPRRGGDDVPGRGRAHVPDHHAELHGSWVGSRNTRVKPGRDGGVGPAPLTVASPSSYRPERPTWIPTTQEGRDAVRRWPYLLRCRQSPDGARGLAGP